jgi:hypothetical protein
MDMTHPLIQEPLQKLFAELAQHSLQEQERRAKEQSWLQERKESEERGRILYADMVRSLRQQFAEDNK